MKSCRYARECIMCTCIRLYMVELTVANAGWWMIASCLLGSYLFPYFLLQYLLNSKIFKTSCLFTFQLAIVAMQLATYTNYVVSIYPIKYVHGLCQSCITLVYYVSLVSLSFTLVTLHSTHKCITASDYHPAPKGVWPCKYVKLHIVVSANV